MQAEFTISFEDDYVKVVSTGDKNLAVARQVWAAIAETCQKHDCYDVLGLSNSEKPVTITEGYAHAELFRDLGITSGYRIAWVELNPDGRDVLEFTETVLLNRGLPGRLFESEKAAIEWLLEGNQT